MLSYKADKTNTAVVTSEKIPKEMDVLSAERLARSVGLPVKAF